MSGPPPCIDLQDLRYRYPDGTFALQGISFRVAAGEKVCLAGPNGAGKSTLLLCLAGLLRAEGTVILNGRDQAPATGTVDPSRIGLVFQSPDDQLFCPTIGEDVAFGPRNQGKTEEEVRKVVSGSLAAVGLLGFEERCAHHLSGGERKRAAIAAVLACQPAILAMDEPWANLDGRACRAVSAILRDFSGTLLVASHNLSRAAAVCERLIVLDEGQVVADGPMADLRRKRTLLEAHGLDL